MDNTQSQNQTLRPIRKPPVTIGKLLALGRAPAPATKTVLRRNRSNQVSPSVTFPYQVISSSVGGNL